MPNIIAKKINITLDTIIQKPKRVDFTSIIGDSIEITINLTENGLPKNITDTTSRVIGIRSDESYFEQNEKIEIVDSENGVLKIYPRLDVLSVEGQCILGLVIEDEDETVNVQRFIVNVGKSIATDIINDVKDDIETLKKLNELLSRYQEELNVVNQSVTDMESLVAEKVGEVSENFEELSNGINTQINTLQNRIDGIDNTVNYSLVKAIKFEPYRLSGSNFIYMRSEVITYPAKELLKKAYDVFLGGILDMDTYNTSLGKLTFYKQNNKIYPFYLSISDRSLNSKTLSPSVVFDDLTGEITPEKIGFRIMIKSNLLKTMNLNDDVVCVLTPLGK